MGDIFFTDDNKTILPKGELIEFGIDGSPDPQSVEVDLKTEKLLGQIRIDVADGTGAAKIENLRLLGSDRKILLDWTKKRSRK